MDVSTQRSCDVCLSTDDLNKTTAQNCKRHIQGPLHPDLMLASLETSPAISMRCFSDVREGEFQKGIGSQFPFKTLRHLY